MDATASVTRPKLSLPARKPKVLIQVSPKPPAKPAKPASPPPKVAKAPTPPPVAVEVSPEEQQRRKERDRNVGIRREVEWYAETIVIEWRQAGGSRGSFMRHLIAFMHAWNASVGDDGINPALVEQFTDRIARDVWSRFNPNGWRMTKRAALLAGMRERGEPVDPTYGETPAN